MRIDPHVHLRDWPVQRHKETLEHGFSTAWKAGLSGVFEMPNTDPALVSEKVILERMKMGRAALDKLSLPLFHGIIAGLTSRKEQVEKIADVWRRYFPRVTGLKMFAGHSTGNMGIPDPEAQLHIYRTLTDLNYTGVLMVHCEKESLLRPELFDPGKPESHLEARPPEAEVESVRDQIRWAGESGFKGVLHICHVSVPQSLSLIEEGRNSLGGRLTCGITPHHALLSADDMKGKDGILLKVNPPLRLEGMRGEMFRALMNGRIDWIETDHAPHTETEKREKYLSGLPVLQFYGSFIRILKDNGIDDGLLEKLTSGNIVRAFNLPEDLFPVNPGAVGINPEEYGFDPFGSVRLKRY